MFNKKPHIIQHIHMRCGLSSKTLILKWYLCVYTSHRESLWHAEFFLLPCVTVKHKGNEVPCFA